MRRYSFRGSELERLEVCPGSRAASDKIERGKVSEIAESGADIHAALSYAVTFDSLKSAEAMKDKAESVAVDMDLTDRERFVLTWFSSIVQAQVEVRGGAIEIQKEIKLQTLRPLDAETEVELSGTLDLEVLTNAGLDVFEYKTGTADQVTAEGHFQGQAYCLLGAEARKLGSARLHVLAAGNPKGEQHTFTDYDEKGLAFIADRLSKAFKAACTESPARIVKVATCKYCPASGTVACTESCQAVDRFGANVLKMTDPVAIFNALKPAQRSETLDRAQLVRAVLDKIIAAAKDGLEQDPGFIPGFRIGEGASVREIPDAREAFKILNEKAGITPAEFSACVEARLTKVKAMFHEHEAAKFKAAGMKPLTKKATEQAVLAILEPVLKVNHRQGSLEKIALTQPS